MKDGTCKNCGALRGLHHYETMQCPVGGVEAPIGRKQEWMTTTYEDDSNLLDKLASQAAEIARLKEAGRPFTHPDLLRVYGGMFNGDDSVVWVRGDATITIGDLRKLAALLKGQQMIIIKDVKTTSDETTQLYTIIIRYIENGQELERITSAQTIIELFNTLRDLDKADGDV